MQITVPPSGFLAAPLPAFAAHSGFPAEESGGMVGNSSTLTAEIAVRAYAEMVNTLDVSKLEPLLADDFRYASQWVFAEIESKEEYLKYIMGKFETIKNTGSRVWAELGEIVGSPCVLSQGSGDPCACIAQDEKEKVEAVVFATVKNNKISRIDMCMPELYPGKRLEIYPGLSNRGEIQTAMLAAT